MKTSRSTQCLTRPGKDRVRIGGDSGAGCDGSELDGTKINDGEVDGNEVGDDEVGKKVQKLSKSKNLSKSKKTIRSDFLISRARLAFTKLRQTFVNAPILYHFDPERHIRIKTDVSNYTIGGVFNQLTLDDSGR